MVGRATLWALAATAAACQTRGAAVPERAASPERRDIAPVAITVFDGTDGPVRSRFSLHEAGDVIFDVRWQAAAGVDGTQILEIYSPDGAVYREERAALGRPMRHVLPVAGSSISRHALTGRWWAELRVLGEATPVAAVEFEIAGDPVAD